MLSHLDTLIEQRLVIVSNRLPVSIKKQDGKPSIHAASGGLITALSPLLEKTHGLWIGWAGNSQIAFDEIESLLSGFQKQVNFSLKAVDLTKEEVELYYEGFSNEIIWPLFHDLHSRCQFDPRYWQAYQTVNQKFADEILASCDEDDFIWIHDYHLILLARDLKRRGFSSKLAFFLHIPFAPLDIFMKIPWRFELLRALLQYDFIGFQSRRDLRNFTQCVHKLLKDVEVIEDEKRCICHVKGREAMASVYPISIDYQEFETIAGSQEVENELAKIRKTLNERKIVFSVDRLDYTKGIPYRLDAIRLFLEEHPEWHEKLTFIEVVVPSRTDIADYLQLKEEIDRLVSDINSEFTTSGWVPVHYLFHSLKREELVAYYRAADVMLVTPVKDGMNLVAKEYCASNIEESGVIVLSEFAGAANQMKHNALLINPYDVEGMAKAIANALSMPESERKKRMHCLRKEIKEHDIFHWVEAIFRSMNPSITDIEEVEPEYLPVEE